MGKRHLAVIAPGYLRNQQNFRGVELCVSNLAEALSERGIRVDLIRMRGSSAQVESIGDNLCLYHFNSSNKRDGLKKLKHYVDEHHPDVLLAARGHRDNLIAAALKKDKQYRKLPVMLSMHNSDYVCLPWYKRMGLIWRMRTDYARADKIITVSRGLSTAVQQFSGLAADHFTTIYNPIVSDRLYAKADAGVDHAWLTDTVPLILSIGQLSAQKDFATLLRAFALVRRHQTARLMILGEGEDRMKLQSLAQELGIADDVLLYGFDPNPFRFLKHADLFVLSSAWEGLPTVLIEAMAVGTPLVSTDCPNGPREILDNGKYGELVAVGNSEALAQAMQKVMGRPPPAELLSIGADRFTITRIADEYMAALGLSVE